MAVYKVFMYTIFSLLFFSVCFRVVWYNDGLRLSFQPELYRLYLDDNVAFTFTEHGNLLFVSVINQIEKANKSLKAARLYRFLNINPSATYSFISVILDKW